MTTKPVTYLFSKNRLNSFEEALKGHEPTEFFYGAVELSKEGLPIQVVEAPTDTPPHWPIAALNFIGQNGPVKLDGCVMQSVYNHLELIRKSSVVVGTTGAHAFALALLKKLKLHQTPIIGIQCALLNHPINFGRRVTTTALMKSMQNMLFGEGELASMIKAYPGCEKHLFVNQFGVDTQFWKPQDHREEGYILSVGNDGCRDYDLLMQAAKRIDKKFIVISNQTLKDRPSNVQQIQGSLTKGVTNSELRDYYQNASCVVVPIKETYQPSGQSVTLQAMACGKSVVLSGIKGLWSKQTIRDGQTVSLVKPDNLTELVTAIQQLLSDPPKREHIGALARQSILEHGNIQMFANTLKNHLNESTG